MSKQITHIFTTAMTPNLFMREYFLHFINNGYKIQVITGYDSFFDEFSDFCSSSNIELFKAPYSRRPSVSNFFQSIFFTLHFFFQSSSTRCVVHTPFASFVVSIISFFSFRRFDFVFYCHGLISYESIGFRGFLLKLVEKFILHQSRSVIFVSNSLKEYAINNGYLASSKIINISGSICGVAPNSSQSKKLTSSHVRLGYFGRISQSKGAFDCFEVARLLQSYHIPFEMHFAGTVEDEDRFFDLFNTTTSVFYHGFVKSKFDFFSKIDILLMPSRREGFGMSALEANSYGLPVIGYDIVGLRDCVINNATGFLVLPKGDYNKLFECVLFYLNNPSQYEVHSSKSKRLAFSRFNQMSVLNEHFEALDKLYV